MVNAYKVLGLLDEFHGILGIEKGESHVSWRT